MFDDDMCLNKFSALCIFWIGYACSFSFTSEQGVGGNLSTIEAIPE